MYEGTYDDRVTKGDNYKHTFLSEPADKQKESVNITTVKEKRLPKVVLIVDDDPDMTSVFSLGLQDEGSEVYTYNDPLEVLSQFRPNFYDPLLVDINMRKLQQFTNRATLLLLIMVTTVLLSVKILTSSSAMSIAWADGENDIHQN